MQEQHSRPKPKRPNWDVDLTPEEKLWRQVVLVTLQDLQLYIHQYKKLLNGKRPKKMAQIRQLVYEIEHPHFQMLCDLADIDHGELRKVCQRIIEGKQVIRHITRIGKYDID